MSSREIMEAQGFVSKMKKYEFRDPVVYRVVEKFKTR